MLLMNGMFAAVSPKSERKVASGTSVQAISSLVLPWNCGWIVIVAAAAELDERVEQEGRDDDAEHHRRPEHVGVDVERAIGDRAAIAESTRIGDATGGLCEQIHRQRRMIA